jgi:hypothetical protein
LDQSILDSGFWIEELELKGSGSTNVDRRIEDRSMRLKRLRTEGEGED